MEPTTERTFSFTVKLPHSIYVKLLAESRKREKQSAAVPSRTARQLITERLEEIDMPAPKKPTATEKETKPIESKKTISGKRGVGENEHPPTEGIE